MAENMRIWDALSKTDPKHTKPFTRAGGFKGTATKPIWLTKRLTEHFGPAGTGWGMSRPEFETVTAGDEILVFCTVALWYEKPTQEVYGVGGDKVLVKRQSGSFTNDEAFKAAYTDALSNAMKQIGVAADIHMGLFDDSKYRDEVGREFANGSGAAPAEPAPSAAPPQYPPDEDVLAGARRWVDEQSGVLSSLGNRPDVLDWNKRNAKALQKLQRTDEALYDKAMKAYDVAFRRTQASAA